MTHSLKTIIPLFLGILVLLGYSYLGAQAPSNPPNSNVEAPINTSGTYQAKAGTIGAVALRSAQLCSADGTNCAVSVLTAADSSDLLVQSTSPNIEFLDTPSVSTTTTTFWLHNNSNTFYLLADRNDDGAWEGAHPLQITAGDASGADIATFSSEVRAREFCERDGTDCFTAADITSLSAPLDTSSFLNTSATNQTKAGTLTAGNLFTGGQVRANNLCDAAGSNCTTPANILDTTGTAQTKSGNLSAQNFFAANTVRAVNYCDTAGGNCTAPANILDTTSTNQTKAGNLTVPILVAQTQVRSDSYCSEAGGNCFRKIQSGNAAVPRSDGSPTVGSFNVTFPTAFANVPTVTFTPRWVRYTGDEPTSWWVTNITTTGFTINWKVPGGGTSIGENGVHWIAID